MSRTLAQQVARMEAERKILIQALALLVAAADDAGCFLYCSSCDTSKPLGKGIASRLSEALQASGGALDFATTSQEYEEAHKGHNAATDTQPELIRQATARLAALRLACETKHPAPLHR